jgi:hypothetical protein
MILDLPVSHLASDASFRATLAAHGLALTETEREMVERLRPLLALPADALLQRLLDDGPDGPQWWWNAPPFPAQTVP